MLSQFIQRQPLRDQLAADRKNGEFNVRAQKQQEAAAAQRQKELWEHPKDFLFMRNSFNRFSSLAGLHWQRTNLSAMAGKLGSQDERAIRLTAGYRALSAANKAAHSKR
jgi:hypothetical protein